MSSKIGVLLMNVGTPDAPDVPAVRRYLQEFLSDRYVISLPYVARMLLLYGIILPFRPKRSAKAYQTVWTEQGSPLRVYSQQCADALQQVLGDGYRVVLGMRYGHPSLSAAVNALEVDCNEVVVVPLFPQYAQATTKTSVLLAQKLLRGHFAESQVRVLPAFYDNSSYIASYASVITTALQQSPCDVLLMSYHGVPCSHLKGLCIGKTVCEAKTPCPSINHQNQDCYRAQCYATSRALAEQLNLSEQQYAVSFQSRLGANAWVQPFTDRILVDLFQQGHRRLAVVCPAFVADCLETLEEIGMALREQWMAMGGESFQLIPCVNAQPVWIAGLKKMIQQQSTAEAV